MPCILRICKYVYHKLHECMLQMRNAEDVPVVLQLTHNNDAIHT